VNSKEKESYKSSFKSDCNRISNPLQMSDQISCFSCFNISSISVKSIKILY